MKHKTTNKAKIMPILIPTKIPPHNDGSDKIRFNSKLECLEKGLKCKPLSIVDSIIKLLNILASANGKAMGLSTIAATLSEDEGTVEDVLEPYLIANGYLERTAKGRVATFKTYDVLKLTPPRVEGTLF